MLSLALYCEILGVTLPCRCRSESYRRYARPPHLSHLGLFPFFLFFFSSLVSIMGIFAHVYLFPFSSTSQETPFFPFACNTSVVCGWQYMLWPAGGLHVSHARTTPGQTVRSCLAMLTGLFFRATLFFLHSWPHIKGTSLSLCSTNPRGRAGCTLRPSQWPGSLGSATDTLLCNIHYVRFSFCSPCLVLAGARN